MNQNAYKRSREIKRIRMNRRFFPQFHADMNINEHFRIVARVNFYSEK